MKNNENKHTNEQTNKQKDEHESPIETNSFTNMNKLNNKMLTVVFSVAIWNLSMTASSFKPKKWLML